MLQDTADSTSQLLNNLLMYLRVSIYWSHYFGALQSSVANIISSFHSDKMGLKLILDFFFVISHLKVMLLLCGLMLNQHFEAVEAL